MSAALLDAVRVDIDRQIGWAKQEVKRQARYTALVGILAGVAALVTACSGRCDRAATTKSSQGASRR